MYLPDFDYYSPATLKGACQILAGLNENARVLAGGTDILTHMKNGAMTPAALVSLKKIQGLQDIVYVAGRGVVIGARATQNDLVNSPVLRERYPSICETAHSMANNQIRNRGTIGGNLVSAVPSADLPPILIALRANVSIIGPNLTRTIPLEQFFLGARQTVMAFYEILTEIVIPDQASTGSAYMKFGLRRSEALAVAGVAASVVADGMDVKEARFVLGAVAPTPIRAVKAEQIINGNRATEALLEDAGRAAAEECKPISDIRGSEEYRRDTVRVFTKRALRKALNMPVPDGTEEAR